MDTENVPLRAADQAALLLDWGFAVPAGTEGVGRLVRPGGPGRPPPPSRDRRAGRGRRPAAAGGRARPPTGTASPLVPAALAGGAVLIVARDADRPSSGRVGRSAGAAVGGVGRPRERDTASIRRRVAVHAAVKKANRATRLIQTSRPTAPPNADAVTLSEIRDR